MRYFEVRWVRGEAGYASGQAPTGRPQEEPAQATLEEAGEESHLPGARSHFVGSGAELFGGAVL